MSALSVKGQIVGKTVKTIKGKNGPFDVATYFIVNGDGQRPLELRSYNTGRKSGEKVDVPVYLKFWRTERGSGCNVVELDPDRQRA